MTGKEHFLNVAVYSKDDKDPSVREVKITIGLKGGIGKSERLQIQLTDENDPFCFYSLDLLECDFQNLKAQQGLLVDFHGFPSVLSQLLEKCKSDPKYKCVLKVAIPYDYIQFLFL